MSKSEFIKGENWNESSGVFETTKSKFEATNAFLPAAVGLGGHSLAKVPDDLHHSSMSEITRGEFEAHLQRLDQQAESHAKMLDLRIEGIGKTLDTKVAAMSDTLVAKFDGLSSGLDGTIQGISKALDSRLQAYEDRVKQDVSDFKNEATETKKEFRSLKTTIWIAALTVVLGIAAFNATVLSNMVASFESGKNTAANIAQATNDLKAAQEKLNAVSERLDKLSQNPASRQRDK